MMRMTMRTALWMALASACAADDRGGEDAAPGTGMGSGSTATPTSGSDDLGTASGSTGGSAGTTSSADTTGDAPGSTATADSSTGQPVVTGVAFEPIAVDDPLVRATDLRFLPGSDELLLLSKDGDIGHYRLTDAGAESLGHFVVPDVHTPSDCGLISVAIDPDFARNRLFFVGQCISQYQSAIYRFELRGDYAAVAATRAEIMVVGHPSASNPWHNVGSMGFDAEGYLWALFGDKTVASSSQDLASNLGAIVRIIPDRSPGGSGYEPAPSNPYYGDPSSSGDVYAYGFRSPWKGVLDSAGRYWVGDVGSNDFEEVDLVTAPAQNFGWPIHEGTCLRGRCDPYVDPVAVWPHAPHPYIEDDPDATPSNSRVAWVGVAYEDRGNDRYGGLLTGKVLFGDSCIGYVRALMADDDGAIVSDEHLGHLVGPTGWDQGPDGYVYVVTYGGCGSGSVDPDDPPPAVIHRVVPT